jgi:hypothetical protein
MRTLLIGTILWLFPCFSGSVFAQRIIYLPESGSGEEIVILCDLPAQARAELREKLQRDPKVAFLYWHTYLFKDGFDLWTSKGRFVLSDGDAYWDIPRETLVEMLGPDGENRLSTPWKYWIPPGLATFGAIAVLLTLIVYFSAQTRAKRLINNGLYQDALTAYFQSLPVDSEAAKEDRARAIAAGVELLQRSGVPRSKAESRLRLLVGEIEREQSYEFRAQAVDQEEAGQWDQAVENFEKAARLREAWDQKDYEYLQNRIQRVRDKQARSKQ